MAQRITSGMMMTNFNRNLNSANARMFKLQHQMETNRKLVRLSDDPVNVVKSLNARSRLMDIEQYQKNLDDADAWLTQTESSLKEMNTIIQRCTELAVYASNDVLQNEDRDAISKELEQLRDQVETLANTSMGGKYIFGGYNMTSAPFQMFPEDGEVLYNGDSMVDWSPDPEDVERARYEINFGLEFDVAISGWEFLGSEEQNVYAVVNDFFNTLSSTSDLNEDNMEVLHANVQPFISKLQVCMNNVLNQLAEVGGRTARIEMMQDRFAVDNINYTQMKSDVEDIDQAKAYTEFTMAEAVYRAALNVGGRILPVSLVEFMR